jgi:hypothetical protein
MNWNIFKRKKKIESEPELIDILVNYIDKAKQLNWEDNEIKDKFKEKHYSNDLIKLAFEIYEVKGGKMIKKKKVEDEELDSEDLDEETEEQEEETDEEEEEKPVKKVVKPVVQKEAPKEEATELTNEQISAVLTNHETRLRELEATLFRLKNI